MTLRDLILKILYLDKIGATGLSLDDEVDIGTLEKIILFIEEN